MTEPQKRYLFRLLAQQGVDGKGAEERLKQLFRVGALREVTKAAASQRIEQMLAEAKEGRKMSSRMRQSASEICEAPS